jgi:hypothetical protein
MATAAAKATDEQKEAALRGFQALWVAGTMGALFTAFARSLPIYLDHLTHSPFDLSYTLDVSLRFGYLLWLLAYFVASNLRVQFDLRRDKTDAFYDVIQSVLALTAAYFLDFLAPTEHRGLTVFAWPTGAIFLICLLALILFYKDEWPKKKLRVFGSALSGGSFVLVLLCESRAHPVRVMAALAVLLAFLFWVLVTFVRIRVRTLEIKRA